jgi:hypothetical protein
MPGDNSALSALDSTTSQTVNYVVEMPAPVRDLNHWMEMHRVDRSKPDRQWEDKLKSIASDAQKKRDLDS